MRMKHLFMPLFGALALMGCNKELIEPSELESSGAAPITLELSLEGTAVSRDEMRAVSFYTEDDIPPTKHEDGISDWQTHCFLRNESGTAQAYALVDWDAREVNGKIHLKMKGHTLKLEQSGSQPLVQPQPGERWRIAGITGGGKLNSDRTRVDFTPDTALDNGLNPNQARVPFTFGWTTFTVSRVSGDRAPKISVHFAPQGSLLNVRVNNKTNRGAESVTSVLKFFTNALSGNGYFDYALGNEAPVWKFTNESAQEETISRPISVAKGAATNYVLWGMPRPETSKPSGGFKSEVYLGRYKIFAEMTKVKPNIRTKGFTSGLAYPMGIDIDRPFMPLEYVADYNVAEDRASFATTHHVSGNAPDNHEEYVTMQQAVDLFSNIKIGGRGYHLPKFSEARGVVPMEVLKDATQNIAPRRHTFEDQSLEIEGLTYGGYRDEVNLSDLSTQYALRFVKDSSKDMVMAYRYVFDINTSDNSYNHVMITSRYVGPKGVTLDEISNPDYWNSNNEEDKSIRLPLVGYLIGSDGALAYSRGSIGDYWLVPQGGFKVYMQGVSASISGVQNSAYRVARIVSIPGSNTNEYRFPIRLFSDRVY